MTTCQMWLQATEGHLLMNIIATCLRNLCNVVVGRTQKCRVKLICYHLRLPQSNFVSYLIKKNLHYLLSVLHDLFQDYIFEIQMAYKTKRILFSHSTYFQPTKRSSIEPQYNKIRNSLFYFNFFLIRHWKSKKIYRIAKIKKPKINTRPLWEGTEKVILIIICTINFTDPKHCIIYE